MKLPAGWYEEAIAVLSSIRETFVFQQLQGFHYLPLSKGSAAPEPQAAKILVHQKQDLLATIRADLGDCRRCRLHDGRKNIVFGAGNPNARLVFVGEAPGSDEDIQGVPFVGKAGQLLTRIIRAIQLERSDVYITNIIKCRPPRNRDPQEDEIRTCIPFLKRQLAVIQPHLICTLGRIASQSLLTTQKSIAVLRGSFYHLGSALVMPTYHPSFLLRYPEKKRETWQDLQKVQKEYFTTE